MSRGQLIVVGTPIGNLSDLTNRAREALASAQMIGCEDTRRTGRLLSHLGIPNPGLVVVNAHTERSAIDRIATALGDGQTVALVSDAGMPTISDPGALVVAAAAKAGHDITVAPGPTAVSAAVALSGFGQTRFVFEGFLPRKGRERKERLDQIAAEERLVVIYEAPHRVSATLNDLAAPDRDRQVAVCRELTKLHEEVWRGPIGQAVSETGEPRGEYVIVLDGAAEPPPSTDEQLSHDLRQLLEAGMSVKDAAADVAKRHGTQRRRVYDMAIELRNQ